MSVESFIPPRWNRLVRVGILILGLSANPIGWAALPAPPPVSQVPLVDAGSVQGLPGVLSLLDGSTLHGRWLGMDPAGLVLWEHPLAMQPLQLGLQDLHRFSLSEGGTTPEPPSRPTCQVELRNGDEFSGDLVELNDGFAAFQTWFGGMRRAPVEALASLQFYREGFRQLYQGPNQLSEWLIGPSPDTWSLQDGRMMSQVVATAGRAFPLGENSKISFDLRWDGPLNASVTLYSTELGAFHPHNSGYRVSFLAGYINVHRVQAGAGSMLLSQVPVPALLGTTSARIEMRVSRKPARLGLWVNDQLTQVIDDPQGFVSQGKGIVFYLHRPGNTFSFGRLLVSEWDGIFEEPETEGSEGGAEERLEHRIRLVNNDEMEGKLASIGPRNTLVETLGLALTVPTERVTRVRFPTPNGEESSPVSPSRVELADGTRLSLEFTSWKDGLLKGVHPSLGPLEIQSTWLRQVEFQRVADETRLLDVDDGFAP